MSAATVLLAAVGCRHVEPMRYLSRAELESATLTGFDERPRVPGKPYNNLATSRQNLPERSMLPLAPSSEPVVIARASRETSHNQPWDLSLPEAYEIAFQHSDVARAIQGGEVQVRPSTSYDPAVAEELTNRAVAAFDVSLGSGFYWNRFDNPPDSVFGPGIPQQTRRDVGGVFAGLTKKWATGADTRVSYLPSPGYLFFPEGNPGGFNPYHAANMEFAIRQPLLKGAGATVNRAPITIAQIRSDQSAWEFKGSMLEFARSIEQAYWDLLAARVARDAIVQQLPLLDEVVRIGEAGLREGRSVASDVAKTRAERHVFRQRLFEAQAAVRERELRLRSLMGLPPQDPREVVPVTSPHRASIELDPVASANAMLNNQPRLVRQRLGVRVREVELLVAKNGLLPQLDLQALYRANGLSERLDRALSMMASGPYHDWEFGATYSMPIGRREAKANTRAADLLLQRERAVLREMVQVTYYQIEELIVGIRGLHAQLEEAEARRRDAEEWLHGARVRYESPPPAGGGQNWLLLALNDYLLALRSSADAKVEAGRLLARYNTELARLRELEGTLLDVAGIHLQNDPCEALGTVSRSVVVVQDYGIASPQPDAIDYRLPSLPHAVAMPTPQRFPVTDDSHYPLP